jgi:tetratricopeptide (TPR) repeat protein
MIALKNLLAHKLAILYIIFFSLIFVLGAFSSYFAIRSSRFSLRFKASQDDYAKLEEENRSLRLGLNKLQDSHKKLEKEQEELSQDRENIINQMKVLVAESNRAKQLQENLENMVKDVQAAERDKQDLKEQNANLRKRLDEVGAAKDQLERERTQLLQAIGELRDKSLVNKLELTNAAFKKENAELANKLSLSQQETVRFKDSLAKAKADLDKYGKEIKDLKDKVEILNKDYAAALNKNRALEQKVTVVPAKFAEIARQNKVLIRQTANMHYNLGVFYSKQKEYTRAIAEFEKALELTPDDAYIHFNLGYIFAEYLLDRAKAVDHFRQYLRLVKKDDKDIDWVRKYILTWETWQGNKPLE